MDQSLGLRITKERKADFCPHFIGSTMIYIAQNWQFFSFAFVEWTLFMRKHMILPEILQHLCCCLVFKYEELAHSAASTASVNQYKLEMNGRYTTARNGYVLAKPNVCVSVRVRWLDERAGHRNRRTKVAFSQRREHTHTHTKDFIIDNGRSY